MPSQETKKINKIKTSAIFRIETYIFLFYCLALNIKKGANTLFAMVALLCLINTFIQSDPIPQIKINRELIKLCLCLTALPLLVLFQIMLFPEVCIKRIEVLSRFMISAMLLFCLIRKNAYQLIMSCYGCSIGAIGTAIWAWNMMHAFTEPSQITATLRAYSGFGNPIPFGSLSITLGFLSLLLPLPKNRSIPLQFLAMAAKWGGFGAGCIAMFYSGSRTAFVAFPFLCMLFIFHNKKNTAKKIVAAVGCIIGLISFTLSNDRIQTRINEGVQDIVTYQINKETSLGARLQMWDFAIELFSKHPIIGIGRGQYATLLQKESTQGRLPPFLAQFDHAHNEYLNAAAEMGLLGLMATISLFLFPGLLFYKHYRSSHPMINFAATAGLIVVVGHAIFCLFDCLFVVSYQTAFYGLSVALFAAIIFSEQQRIEKNRLAVITD